MNLSIVYCNRFLILVTTVLILVSVTQAQLINGGTIVVSNGAQLACSQGITNTSGTLNIIGTMKLGGNLINNGVVNATAGSTFRLESSVGQHITGSAINAWNVVVNNPGGITLNTDLHISGSVMFTSGNITTTGNYMVGFANGSSFANSPTDASHISGRVGFYGTGNFVFPIGNAVKYQPIGVDLSANSGGLSALYHSGNAGTGSFTTGGSSPTPLLSYNDNEYWTLDLPSSGLHNAAGTVTIFWDGYNDTYGNPPTERTTAHKINSEWQNEGGNASGTTTSGFVTSNSIGSWGIFTLGSIGAVLPVRWIALNGRLNNIRQPEINWTVAEQATLSYDIEKSSNGTEFLKIGSASGKGDGTNSYRFTEDAALWGNRFYRIRQSDKNGLISYSTIIKLSADELKRSTAAIYPSIVTSAANLNITVSQERRWNYFITNQEGKVCDRASVMLAKGMNVIPLDLSKLAPGTYTLVLPDSSGNVTVRFVRL